MAVIVTLAALWAVIAELLPLVRAKKRKESIACGCLLLAGYTVLMLVCLQIPLPSPTTVIRELFGRWAL